MKFQSCQTARERFPWSTLPQGSCPLWLAQPQNQIVAGSCGAREPGLDFHRGTWGCSWPMLAAAWGAVMSLCHRCITCARKHAGNASRVFHRQGAFRLVLAVTERQETSLSFCSAEFLSACKGLYRHAFSCGTVWSTFPELVLFMLENRTFPQQQPGLLRSVTGRGDRPSCVK